MEIKIKRLTLIFILILFLTLLFARIPSYFLMDMDGYNSNSEINSEKITTPTALLRQATGLDIHHIHLGVILFCVVIPLMLIGFVNVGSVIFFGIGISLIADQIFPLLNFGNYFGLPMALASLSLHLIIIEIVLINNYKERLNYFP